jgi:hypothetical protein
MYKLFVPAQAVGASLVYFDLFNPASSGANLKVHSVLPVVSGAVAVTGVVAVDLFLTRTTAVGTGGTGATFEGTSLTAATIVCVNGDQPLTAAQVSARLTPAGGATGGVVLAHRSLFSEETNGGTYTQIDLLGTVAALGRFVQVRAGTGIRVIQGGVASVGNIGFEVLFSL